MKKLFCTAPYKRPFSSVCRRFNIVLQLFVAAVFLNAPLAQAQEFDQELPDRPRWSAKIDIPVTWYLTVARRQAMGAATVTEIYRSTWSLETNQDRRMFLSSRHARVSVYRTDDDVAPAMPSQLRISEHDLAKVLGLVRATDVTPNGYERMLQLVLNHSSKNTNEFLLHFSENEHFSVLLRFGE